MVYYLPNNMVIKDVVSPKRKKIGYEWTGPERHVGCTLGDTPVDEHMRGGFTSVTFTLGGCWRFTFWWMLMDIAQMDIAQIHLTMKLLLEFNSSSLTVRSVNSTTT